MSVLAAILAVFAVAQSSRIEQAAGGIEMAVERLHALSEVQMLLPVYSVLLHWRYDVSGASASDRFRVSERGRHREAFAEAMNGALPRPSSLDACDDLLMEAPLFLNRASEGATEELRAIDRAIGEVAEVLFGAGGSDGGLVRRAARQPRASERQK